VQNGHGASRTNGFEALLDSSVQCRKVRGLGPSEMAAR
jgi:hypothetical protein